MYPLCEHTLKLTQVCCFAGLPRWGAWKPPRSRGNMTQVSCFYIEYLAIEEWFCSLGWLGSMIEMSPTKETDSITFPFNPTYPLLTAFGIDTTNSDKVSCLTDLPAQMISARLWFLVRKQSLESNVDSKQKIQIPKVSEEASSATCRLSYSFLSSPPIGVPQDLTNLQEVGLNPSGNQVSLEDGNFNYVGKEVKGCTQTFYQVLIDARDCPYIRAQTEAVTFLGNQDSSRSLYAIPGLDYVSHEDILPYTTTEKLPLQHELFDKFLMYYPEKDPPFGAQETLRAWQKKNHPWLELSDVHKETTENVRVTVIPFYMGCRESQAASVFWWRYCIRLENVGELSVQLRERHWRIFSLSGTLETVRGRGVVGQEPVLSPSLPAFQYSSHVSLQAPSGHMWGTFRMEREDGYTFDCRIPPFSLESKSEDTGTNTSAV
uniref:ApaG domain-containing protein n=1 Tax=Timema bartmani TaxID=61472 RepID=A0A7R9EYA9_9NEOP|nr:unnamed protein product [Timema bartmani]